MPRFRSSILCEPVLERVSRHGDPVVVGEKISRRDRDFFDLAAVDRDLDRHLRTVFAAGFPKFGKRLDRDSRVAGAVPIGGMFAIVEQILRQT